MPPPAKHEPGAPRRAAAPYAGGKEARIQVEDFQSHVLAHPEVRVDWPDEASRRARAEKFARMREEMARHHNRGLMMFPPIDDEGRTILHKHGPDCPPDCDDESHQHGHDHDHDAGHDHGDGDPPPADRDPKAPDDGGDDHDDDGHSHGKDDGHDH